SVETVAGLEAAACRACGKLFLPVAPVCPDCWSNRIGRRRLSGRGEVATFTIYRQAYDADFPPPYVLAVIALREGPRMVSNVIGCAPESVRVGMKVAVRFVARGDRILPLFAPDVGAADPDSTRTDEENQRD
ncbi:MAG: hypothetical protein F9K19_23400, partial [Rhizobiaceae bacterium]